MKKAIKEYFLEIRDIYRNKSISTKRVTGRWVYAVTKNIFKAGKVLVTVVHGVNMKMLFTNFYYNLYKLKKLKIKEAFWG